MECYNLQPQISTQVQIKAHPIQWLHNYSTKTASLKLTLSGKDYIYFQIDGRTARSFQYAKSRALIKVIETIMSIGSFEQNVSSLKG